MAGVPISWGHVSTPLSPRPIDPAWIRDGAPVARGAELWRSRDGMSCTIVWECTPGRFEWRYDTDETIQILEGAIVLDDGVAAPRRLGPGDLVYIPAGAVVVWTVEETVRKLAFFRRLLPAPLSGLTRFARFVLKRLRGGAAGGGLMAEAPAAAATEAAHSSSHVPYVAADRPQPSRA